LHRPSEGLVKLNSLLVVSGRHTCGNRRIGRSHFKQHPLVLTNSNIIKLDFLVVRDGRDRTCVELETNIVGSVSQTQGNALVCSVGEPTQEGPIHAVLVESEAVLRPKGQSTSHTDNALMVHLRRHGCDSTSHYA